ncbi:hypothetical protein ACTFIR_009974 [Dictyostelium discoideum]
MASPQNWKNCFNKKAIEVIEIQKSQETITVETINNEDKSKNNISKSKIKEFKKPIIKSISKLKLQPKFSRYNDIIDNSFDFNSNKNYFFKQDKVTGNTFIHVFCEKRESKMNLESDIENLKCLGKEMIETRNKNNESALFSTLKNQNLGLKIMNELISRNFFCFIDNGKLQEELLTKCLEEGRVDMVKYLITIDFNLISKLKRMCQIIQVSPTTLQFVKLINSEYEKIVEIGLKSAGREYIKLFFIQFILGNFSKESIIQTIDEYKLPPIPKEIEDFFFVYNYQMCDFEKLTEIKPRYLNEITKIKIYPTSQVSIERNELGRGGNGTVHSGVLKEIDCQGNEISIPVAIKIPTRFNKSKLIEVYKELAIHQKINGICGPKLFGCVKLNVGFGIIIERFDCSLHDYIDNNNIDFDLFFELALKMVVTIKNLHKCHLKEIFHRDIKPHNWLVKKTKDELVVVLSDFGLSRENSETNENTLQKYRGTSVFVPPELNDNILYNDKSDIYSLGVSFMMLLYKVVYGKMENPFYEFIISKMEYFKTVVALENFLVPIVPTFLPDSFKEFLFSTMNRIYTCRPNSEECVEIITTLKTEYENDKTKWQVNSAIIQKEKSLLTDSIISQQLKLMNQVKKFVLENDKFFLLKKTKLYCSESEIKQYLLSIIKFQE